MNNVPHYLIKSEVEVEIALFYIDDRHLRLAAGPQTGHEDTAQLVVFSFIS